MSRWSKVFEKVRRAGPKKVLQQLRPRAVDEFLFEVTPSEVAETTPSGLVLRRFTASERSGIARIDSRLVGERVCYAFMSGDEVAHMSWLFFDTLLPSHFEFDGRIPVVGDCETPTRFRGKNLYPTALRFIAHDLATRKIADRYYILVSPDNAPSIRGIEKAGGRRLARLQGIKILGTLVRKQRS